MIHQLFLSYEVDTILSILISSRLLVDKKIWAETANGHFNVHSAYKIAVEMATKHTGSSSGWDNLRLFWKKVWKLHTPHKIRHFSWRACRDILPTKSNLKHRGVIQNDMCSICGEGVEDSGRVFWLCSKAKEVWSGAKLFPPG